MSGDDWVKIIGAIGTTAVLILGAMTALYVKVAENSRRLKDVHYQVNGRLEELIKLTATSARAEGRLQGPQPPVHERRPGNNAPGVWNPGP